MSDDPTVAIACQGGGSHTAFTAGVLRRLLPAVDDGPYDLVGLSGTSGGAITAAAGWYGLRSGETTAPAVLEDLWADIAAQSPADTATNAAVRWGARLEELGVPLPEIAPYWTPSDDWGQQRLRRTLESNIDFESVPRLATDAAPRLVVGAVDITDGSFETFVDGDVTATALLASAAVPSLFAAVEVDGDYHWDGLLSQNPPIRDHFQVPPGRKPDELWVVQINPQTRDEVPRSLRGIIDRRNELAGNLSLNQELHFVERVNDWVDQGKLADDDYKHTAVRRIGIDRDLDYASKLDRDPAFIEDLIEHGDRRGEAFLDGL